MHANKRLSSTQRIGTGLSFVIFPIVFVFAFSVHPGLLDPHLLGPSELILRARGAGLLQFAHALVTLNTALLVVVALHFMKLLDHSSGAWAGFIGAAMAVLGSLALVGVALIAMPDGLEVVNLTASVLLTIAFVPYGIRIMRSENQEGERTGPRP